MTVLLIALGHGLIVWFIATATESRFWTVIAAIAAVALGIFTGQPIYMLVDVAAVVIALSLCWPKKKPVKKPEAPPPPKATGDSSGDGWLGILAVVGAAIFIVAKNYHSPPPPSDSPASQPTVNTQTAAPAPASKPAQPVHLKPKKPQPKKAQQPTMESCLKLVSDTAMARCLEKLP